MTISRISVLGVLFLVATTLFAQTTIHVPGDQPTIQSAIAAANNGDTVLVSSGTYTENINFGGKAITVTSASGPSVTIIDGGAKGSVVTFNTGEGLASVLNGFTIRNGKTSSSGAGIEINNASPTIAGDIITNNHTIEGIGIEVHGGSPLIMNNTITGNTQAGGDGGCGGGGILTWGSSSNPASPTITGNIISNNSVSGGGSGGGIATCYYGSPIIQNNLIEGNYAYNYGGGIEVESYSGALVSQNVIENNSVGGGGSGGGVAIYAGPNVTLVDNTIVGNSAFDHSSGVYVGSASPLLNTIANNIVVASAGQTAAVCASTWSSLSPVFDHNDLYSATGAAFSGVCDLSSTPGNITTDPLLADPVSLDLHLSTGSPAIDAGDGTISPIPSADFDGAPRIVNGGIDMGAYEYQGTTTFNVSPGSLSFNPQNVSTTSSTQPVTVTNTGVNTLHFHPMQVGSDFTQNNNCSGPNGLAIGQSCTLQVAFAPQSPGTKSETLTISGANSASNGSVSLSGQAMGPAASMSPGSLVFGGQMLNTTSSAKPVTLTNVGNQSLIITSIGASGDFAVTHNCSTLAAGANCTANVTFKPSASGTRSGTLSITDNASNSPQSVSLSGIGTAPAISFSPLYLSFPVQAVGTSSAPQTLTVTNTGTAPLVINSLGVSGSFTAVNNCTAPVSPSASCTVQVTFLPTQPTTTDAAIGYLSFYDNISSSMQSVNLTGTILAPIASVSPTSMSFPGSTMVGTQSASISILYQNTGNSPLTISSIAVAGDFAQSNTCGTTLTPSASCTIAVMFMPTTSGSRYGTVTITDNAGGSPRSVTLYGQATSSYPAPTLTSVSPNMIAVGSSTSVFTVSGTGFVPVSTVFWDNQPLATMFVNSTTLKATPPPSGSASWGNHSVTVQNPAPGGGTSNALQVTAYISLPYSANDLAYDPYRQVFYASIEAASTVYPNAILAINPASGQISTLATISSNPDRLTISEDGQFLWVGSDGDHTIKRINLYTNAIDLIIPLGADPLLGPYSAQALAALPGAPHSLAVTIANFGYSPSAQGVKIYDDGKARAQMGGGYYTTSIAFGSSSSTLYGADLGFSPVTLIKMNIDSSGTSLAASQNLASPCPIEIKYMNGILYCDTLAYDANSLAEVGSFSSIPTSTAFISSEYPEPGTGMIYLVGTLSNGVGNPGIWAGNASTYATTGPVVLPDFGYSYSQLARWGRDGLAFFSAFGGNTPSSADQIVFLRSSITNPATSNNPVPAITSLSPPNANVGAADLQLLVAGSNFAPGAVVQWNGSDVTTRFLSSSQLLACIPASAMASPSTATVTVINLAPGGGTSNASNFSISLQQPATPVLTWLAPASITYGTPLSTTQLNAAASVPGTFVYTPAAGSVPGAGAQTLSVTFTPTDTTNYAPVTGTVTLTVNQATPTVAAWPAASAIGYGQMLTASTLSGGSAPVLGTFAFTTPTTAPALGSYSASVTFTPNDSADYATVTGTVLVTVNQGSPTVTAWPSATAITFGQTLASSTLSNGSASVPGSFAFIAPTTVPGAGSYAASVIFTPSNTTDYATVTNTVNVTVNKAAPTVTNWPAATAITYGQTLASSTLTGGVASAPGSFAFATPTTAPQGGTYSETVSFTPTDTTDYSSAAGTVTVTVNKATPAVSFAGAPASAPYKATFTVTATTNASTTPTIAANGACTIAGSTVTITAGSGTCSLSAAWAADNNYLAASTTQSTAATPISQTITVGTPAPASAAFGSSFVVSATASSGLTVAFSAAGGCTNSGAAFTMTSGTTSCTVQFSQVGNSIYAAAPQVTEIVAATKATQSITFPNPGTQTYGVGSITLAAKASSGIAVSYAVPSGPATVSGSVLTITGAGAVTVQASQTGNASFAAATPVSVTLTVNKANSTTSIKSEAPNPSHKNKAVIISFSVTGTGGPTGTVKVNASTGEQCTGTLSSGAGNCSVTFATTGSRTLRASYPGDKNFNGSASSNVTQQVQP